ncbi:MAG: hypothetical protein HYV34_01010 [Candidatus Kerfeldbacteria bacterium]|nr:hypothetical protein [Candidatus Kerfeldbacteria bacterium]
MLITVRGRALEMRPPSVSEYLAFSPSLVSYILPASDHRLFGTELKNEITDRSRENDTFLGYAFLLLIALAAASWRFTQTDRPPLVRLLWIVFFLTIVLSFGAALRGRTEYYALGMGSNIENIFAPYVLFRYIPYYSQLHVPSRILLLAVPIGAILAGWGFVRFTERFRISRKQSWGIVVGMSVLLFVDNFRMPLDLVQPPQASPWLTELQKMDGDFAVFELPVYVHERDLSTFDTFDLNTFQTIHEKRTMNGYLSRAPRKIFMDLNAPGIRYLAIRDETTEDDRNRDLVMPFFWERNMRYALMYKTYFSKDEQEQLDSYLRSVLEFPVEFEDELLRVYTIPSVSP